MPGVSLLEDLVAGAVVEGIEPSGPVTVVSAVWHGDQAITLTYRDVANQPREQLLYRSDEGTFTVQAGTRRAWSFDGDGNLFRLAAEARRIHLAHLFDPYLALTSSEVDPLPHQIEAVYGGDASSSAAPVPPRRRPGRRQDDHGRPLHQGADHPR